MKTRQTLEVAALLLASVPPALSQVPLSFSHDDRPVAALTLAIDEDDSDEDGVMDRESDRLLVPSLTSLRVHGRGRAQLRTDGEVRLVNAEGIPQQTLRVTLPATVRVQATGRRGEIIAEQASATRLPVEGVHVRFEGPEGPLDPRRDALAPTQQIPNDSALPRGDGACTDPRCFRVVVEPAINAPTLTLERRGSSDGQLIVRLTTAGDRSATPWLRLVVDEQDEHAPGVNGRLLRAALRDEIRARVGHGFQSLRVGRPSAEDGPLAARRGRMRVRIVRHAGVPAVGTEDAGAVALGRMQIAIANEIWLQCLADFGAPEDADVAVVDPPPPWLLSVADRSGFPSAGGEVRFRAGDRSIRVVIPEGSDPPQSAWRIASALRAEGFTAEVFVNPRTTSGADRSADVLVSREGTPVTLAPDGSHPLTTDRRQAIAIGRVDLADGLQSFTNDNAQAGSLEERTLLHHVLDADPTTIDLVIVNRFTGGARQGEAFIEADRGVFANVVILDRSGIRQQRSAWTQSHELGHVLLDIPFHPDDLGPNRPWLLMDADASSPVVTGPKRISPEECARARHRSGAQAYPSLLQRY
ncbi:MAG: hypothetical protein AAGE52_25055 [Myxococcota bacterium]